MWMRFRRDEGAAALEFGLVLPVLMLLAALSFPLIKSGYEYIVLSRAVAHGVRYASRADVNARYVTGSTTQLTRRPNPTEVTNYIKDVVGPGLATNVTSVAVNPDPSTALSGEPIQVQAKYRVSFGVLDDIANAVRGVFFGEGAYLPDSKEVTVSARGREE